MMCQPLNDYSMMIWCLLILREMSRESAMISKVMRLVLLFRQQWSLSKSQLCNSMEKAQLLQSKLMYRCDYRENLLRLSAAICVYGYFRMSGGKLSRELYVSSQDDGSYSSILIISTSVTSPPGVIMRFKI